MSEERVPISVHDTRGKRSEIMLPVVFYSDAIGFYVAPLSLGASTYDAHHVFAEYGGHGVVHHAATKCGLAVFNHPTEAACMALEIARLERTHPRMFGDGFYTEPSPALLPRTLDPALVAWLRRCVENQRYEDFPR